MNPLLTCVCEKPNIESNMTVAHCTHCGLPISTVVEGETRKVNRVEIIDHTKSVEEGGGRAYVFWEDSAKVEVSMQDEGRTMKIFIRK